MKKITICLILNTLVLCDLSLSNAQPWENQPLGVSSSFNQPDYSSGAWLTIESVGIGDFKNLGSPPFPLSALHVNTNLISGITPNYANFGEVFRTDCPNISTYWRMLRSGTLYGEAFHLVQDDDNIHWHLGAPEGELRFHATMQRSGDPGTYNERMRISSGTGFGGETDVTKIAIHYQGITGHTMIDNYVAMLNLGEDSYLSLGTRDWMDVGSLMVKKYDQMYVGIKDEGDDRGTAVINWGDNPNGSYGPDLLKFIFSTIHTSGSAQSMDDDDGLEIARMTPEGNVGVGEGWNNSTIMPKRRIDIVDNASSNSSNQFHTYGPQLRLTNTPSTSLTGGIYSDFWTTSSGNLIITPWNSSLKYVGIGDNAVFTTPQNLLHQHIVGTTGSPLSNWHQFTTNITNATATDGCKIGIEHDAILGEVAQFRQQENAPMTFHTTDGTTDKERVRITYGVGQQWPYSGGGSPLSNVTKVNINYGNGVLPISTPVALLNLGEDPPNGVQPGGQRSWMDVGTFGCLQTDNAYFGLKREGASDHFDAVVSWGDNVQAPDGADNLRFIFSAPLGLSGTQNAGSVHGLEVMRATAIGRIGIGNFCTYVGNGSGIQPSRRLEIYDENLDPYLGNAAPQLRLTYTPHGTTTLGKWTDFQTTLDGNLYIHPSSDATTVAVNMNVGINTSTPQRTLEINSNDSPTSPATGNSGLRLADLTTASTPVTTPWTAGNHSVLSVNANGDVILVKDDDQAGTGTVTACTTGGGSGVGTVNYITKFVGATDICNSTIWENSSAPNNVGINTTSPGATLDLESATTSPVSTVLHLLNKAGNNSHATSYGMDISTLCTGGSSNINYGAYLITNGAAGENYGVRTVVTSGLATPTSNYGGHFSASDAAVYNRGVFADAIGDVSGDNIGGMFYSSGASSINYGILAHAYRSGSTTGSVNCGGRLFADGDADQNWGLWTSAEEGSVANYGVNASAGSLTPGVDNFGVYGLTTATTGNRNYAIFGDVSGGGDCTNMGGCTIAAGYFNGDVYSTTSVYFPSDSMLKNNINSFSNDSALSILKQIPIHTYQFDTANYPQMNLEAVNQIGLISEEIELVLPNLVKSVTHPAKYDSSGNIIYQSVDYKAVNKVGLIPILIAAINGQQTQIDSLRQLILSCCSIAPKPDGHSFNNENKQTIELKDVTTIILKQNVPNPFAEETDINYILPATVKNATILIYDKTGNVLKKVDLHERGEGTLHIYAPDLSSGAYTYSLIADGNLIETKTMVKIK